MSSAIVNEKAYARAAERLGEGRRPAVSGRRAGRVRVGRIVRWLWEPVTFARHRA